jgi:hypothetical protein
MPGLLTQFRIEGLHHNRTIDIPITDNKLVLVGENGTGKSTVANFIYFLLTTQWTRMLEYDFKSITAVIDSKEYRFSHNDISNLARRDFIPGELLLPAFITQELETIVENFSLEESLIHSRRIAQELKVPYQLIRREIERIQKNAIPKEFKETVQSLKESIADQVLYLPTYRRIERDLETIFPQLEGKLKDTRRYSLKKAKDTGYIELVEFGMEDVESTIKHKMIEIKENVRKDLSNLTGAYLRDVIHGTYQSIEPSKLKELDEHRVDEIFKRIPEDILSEKDKENLRSIIAEIKIKGKISDDNKVVAHFLTKLIQLYQKQQEDERDIREFVKVCNEGYLSGKQFVYDDVSFDVFIKQQQNENDDTPHLPMRALSSGEKQIISLFSHLYLSGKSGFFVIIDEPELSLLFHGSNVSYQIFLKDVMD